MNKLDYKGRIKTPMDFFVIKRIYDLCYKTEQALFKKGWIYNKDHEFIFESDTKQKCWLYIMNNHLIWSKNDMSSYYFIKNDVDIETSINGRTIEDVRNERLKLILAYHKVNNMT